MYYFEINISCEVVSIKVRVTQVKKRKQLLDELKEMINEAIDRNLKRTHLGRGYGRVGRQYRIQHLNVQLMHTTLKKRKVIKIF